MKINAFEKPAHTYRFGAYLKWGGPSRQFAPGETGLPHDLVDAASSWGDMHRDGAWDEQELSRIRAVVQSHLEVLFVPDNLADGTNLLSIEEKSIGEFEVVDVDFSSGPIPTICVQAFLDLTFAESIRPGQITNWEEQNDSLSWAFVFGYKFEYGDEDDPLVWADAGNAELEVYGPMESHEMPATCGTSQ